MKYLYEIHLEKLFGHLNGVKILELGCGSNEKNIYKVLGRKMSESDWEPHLARTLQEIGADVTGIDVLEAKNPNYNHIVANLMKKKLTKIVKNQQYDLIIAQGLFDSWQLNQCAEEENFRSIYDNETWTPRSFIDGLVREISLSLNKNGSFIAGPMDFNSTYTINLDPRPSCKKYGLIRDFKGNVNFFGQDSWFCEKYDKKLPILSSVQSSHQVLQVS